MVERQEVEALLAACKPGSETFVEAMDKLSRRKVAALCRAWLAVEEAPKAVVECNGAKGAWLIAADDAPLSEGQRVRIVKEVG